MGRDLPGKSRAPEKSRPGAAIYRTSITHPLDIADVEAAPSYGCIGLSACPGRKQLNAVTGRWYRDLSMDLNAISHWGAAAVISLIEKAELQDFDIEDIGDETCARHMIWVHLPVRPGRIWGWRAEARWAKLGPQVRSILRQGFNVCIHSREGTHRAAHFAQRVLIELGVFPQEAQRRLQAVSPSARLSDASHASLEAIPYCPEPWPETDPAAVRRRVRGMLLGGDVAKAYVRAMEVNYPPTNDRPSPARHGAADTGLLCLAPLVVKHHRNRLALKEAAARQAYLADPAPESVDACIAFADMLADAIGGKPVSLVLSRANFMGTDTIATLLAGSWRGQSREKIRTTGLARHSLEAALWATARGGSFQSAIETVVSLDGHRQALAEITGQLAGALYGAPAIPRHWRRALP